MCIRDRPYCLYSVVLCCVDRKLTVVMNEHHMHELTAIAEVVPKTLTLDPKAVEIKTIEDPFSPDFYSIRVGSSLSTPVNFSWDIPAGSPFKIEPLSGVSNCMAAGPKYTCYIDYKLI